MLLIKRVAAITFCMMVAACSTNVSRYQMPGTNLAEVEKLYVRPIAEERDATEIKGLIEADLERRGFTLVAGDEPAAIAQGALIVDTSADWHWDITWYLLELRVAIYDPNGDTLVAQAQSQQTSLVRKSNEVVVQRTMASLFNDEAQTEGDE